MIDFYEAQNYGSLEKKMVLMQMMWMMSVVYDLMESVLGGANQGVCLSRSHFLSSSRRGPTTAYIYIVVQLLLKGCLASHHTLMSLALNIRQNNQTKHLINFFCLVLKTSPSIMQL